MRIEPPLVITYTQLDTVLDRLEDIVNEINRNPYRAAPEKIRNISIEMTIVGGKLVYKKE